MIVTQNRIKAFYIGITTTIGSWYALILMTHPQKKIKISENQYIGLGIAIVGYILWWLKFCFVMET